MVLAVDKLILNIQAEGRFNPFMLFDPWTLWIVVLAVGFLLAGSLLFVWLLTPTERALGYWALFTMLQALGIAGVMARSYIPSFMSIELANAAVLLSNGLLWLGIRRFDRQRGCVTCILLLPLLWIVLCQFPFFQDSVVSRLVLGAVLSCATLIPSLLQLRSGSKPLSRARSAVFVILLVIMGIIALRIPLASSLVENNRLIVYSDPRLAFTGLLVVGVALFLNCALVLMVRERSEMLYRNASRRDDLTGLLNRRGFMELALERCGGERSFALLFLDLDHFKQINDRLGHAAGDRVLVVFANVLRRELTQSDAAGRLGGDEFVVLLCEPDGNSTRQASERIQKSFRLELDRLRLDFDGEPCSVSIGVVVSVDEKGRPMSADMRLEGLMKRGDAMLYGAKSGGRNRIEVG